MDSGRLMDADMDHDSRDLLSDALHQTCEDLVLDGYRYVWIDLSD